MKSKSATKVQNLANELVSWNYKKLDKKVLAMKSGFACARKNAVSNGIPHLRPFNIGLNGELNLSNIIHIPKNFQNNFNEYYLEPGDILFNNTNSIELVGKSTIIRNYYQCGFSNHLTRLRILSTDQLDPSKGSMEPLNDQTITPWQKAASDFLISFYEKVLRQASSPGTKNPGFPSCIFSDNDPSTFGAQNFLSAFQNENRQLSICPACDESKYSTKAGSIKTDIDHYLPKSKYPHLSCHPYNLVPSCLVCNQRIKRESDPLTCQKINPGNRRQLEDIFCLYREPGLWDKTYLEVSLKSKNQPTQIGSLKTQVGWNIETRIEALQDTYRIPERWREQVDEIENYIYRQLKSLLNAFHISLDDSQILLDCLDYSLITSYIEERGQQQFSISRAWLLAALINEMEEVLKTSSSSPAKSSALLDELKRRLVNDVDAKSPNKSSTANLFQKAEARSSIDKARQLRSILTGN